MVKMMLQYSGNRCLQLAANHLDESLMVFGAYLSKSKDNIYDIQKDGVIECRCLGTSALAKRIISQEGRWEIISEENLKE